MSRRPCAPQAPRRGGRPRPRQTRPRGAVGQWAWHCEAAEVCACGLECAPLWASSSSASTMACTPLKGLTTGWGSHLPRAGAAGTYAGLQRFRAIAGAAAALTAPLALAAPDTVSVLARARWV